jgi:hypothetical protein
MWKDKPEGDGFYWLGVEGSEPTIIYVGTWGSIEGGRNERIAGIIGKQGSLPLNNLVGRFLRIEPPRTHRCAGCGASLASTQSPFSGNHIFICATQDCPEAGLIRIDLGGHIDGV